MYDPHRNDLIAVRMETEGITPTETTSTAEPGQCIGSGARAFDNTTTLLMARETKPRIGFTQHGKELGRIGSGGINHGWIRVKFYSRGVTMKFMVAHAI
jgi:hypothetical protein